MEQFDKIWGIIAAVIPMAMGIATLVVNATETPRDNEIVGKIALIIGRIFSFSSFRDKDGKANISIPVLQSAKPKSEK
jgi:hypothetical protein